MRNATAGDSSSRCATASLLRYSTAIPVPVRATARHGQEDRVRIAGEKAQPDPAATGAAAEQEAGAGLSARRRRRRRVWITLTVVATLLVGINAYAAYELTSISNNANPGPLLRPTGIPG